MSLSIQAAADRCKVKFASSDTEKQHRWLVSESNPVPVPIASKHQLQETDTPPGKQVEETPSEEGAEDESLLLVPAPAHKGKRRRGQKGRPKGEIYFTELEHEMIEWARNGFLPSGPKGLWPSEKEQQDLFTVVPADAVDSTGESNTETFDFPAPPKKKFAALMKQQKGQSGVYLRKCSVGKIF